MKYRNIFGGLKALQVGMIMTITSIVLMLVLLEIAFEYKFGGYHYSFIDDIWDTLFYIAQFVLLTGVILKIVGLSKAKNHNGAYKAAHIVYIVELFAVTVSALIGVTSYLDGIPAAWILFFAGTITTYILCLIGAKRLVSDVFGDDENRFSRRHKALYVILCIVFLFVMPVIVQAVLLHKVKDVKTFDDWVRFEADIS